MLRILLINTKSLSLKLQLLFDQQFPLLNMNKLRYSIFMKKKSSPALKFRSKKERIFNEGRRWYLKEIKKGLQLAMGSLYGRLLEKKKFYQTQKVKKKKKSRILEQQQGSSPLLDIATPYLIWAFCQRGNQRLSRQLPVQLKALEQTHAVNCPHTRVSLWEKSSSALTPLPVQNDVYYQVQVLLCQRWFESAQRKSVLFIGA